MLSENHFKFMAEKYDILGFQSVSNGSSVKSDILWLNNWGFLDFRPILKDWYSSETPSPWNVYFLVKYIKGGAGVVWNWEFARQWLLRS